MDICLCITDKLCCMPETNFVSRLYSKKKKRKKKKRKDVSEIALEIELFCHFVLEIPALTAQHPTRRTEVVTPCQSVWLVADNWVPLQELPLVKGSQFAQSYSSSWEATLMQGVVSVSVQGLSLLLSWAQL